MQVFQIPGAISADSLYTSEELASRLGVGINTQRKWRGEGLKASKVGRRLYYLGSDVIEHIKRLGRKQSGPLLGIMFVDQTKEIGILWPDRPVETLPCDLSLGAEGLTQDDAELFVRFWLEHTQTDIPQRYVVTSISVRGPEVLDFQLELQA